MDFYKRVAIVCGQIPKGTVATYGQISLLCGKPRNARQVGYALNRKLSGEDIPAHRVINAQGFLSGAGAFGTPKQQKGLLEAEGVKVSAEQTVDLRKYGWNHTMDLVLWLREHFEKEGI